MPDEATACEVGDEAPAGGAIGGRTMNPRDSPCGTRVVAVIVVLLVLAWAAGWLATAGPPPAAPTQ